MYLNDIKTYHCCYDCRPYTAFLPIVGNVKYDGLFRDAPCRPAMYGSIPALSLMFDPRFTG